MDRTAYFGAADDPATEYRMRDSDPNGGGDFVLAERADGSEILLQWDDAASEWVSAGAVNLDGSDVRNVAALDADSTTTGDATVGGDGDGNVGPDERAVWSAKDVDITVTGTAADFQAELNSIPWNIRGRYRITWDSTGETDADFYIPPHISADVATASSDEYGRVILEGDVTNQDVSVGSIVAGPAIGNNTPVIRGFEFNGGNPYDNENAVFVNLGGSNSLFIQNTVLGDGTGKGVIAYSGGVTVEDVDFGTDNREVLMENKHNGSIWVTGDVSGSATDRVFSVASNPGIAFDGENTNLSGQNAFVNPNRGYLINFSAGRIYAGEGLPLGGERETVVVDTQTITPERAATLRISTSSTSTSITTIDGTHAINGDRITITNRADGNNTTLEHLTDNIFLEGGSNKTLNSARDTIQLRYNGTNWIQEWYADL